MSFELHPNRERGHLDHGWLKTAHSFSFAHYVNEKRMNFGTLLVLNEDTIQAGAGFGEHYHDNMEIVTIPLSGSLRHGDSMGNSSIIQTGEVQIMSAGTGLMHSEHNASTTEPVHLLQIWIVPNTRGLPTRYAQLNVKDQLTRNAFHEVVSPIPSPKTLLIHQNAWFSLGNFEAGRPFHASLHDQTYGAFLFVIKGKIQMHGQTIETGDAIALQDELVIDGTVIEPSSLLLIEVPMNFSN